MASTIRRCPVCSGPVVRRGSRGPMPTYCSTACKRRANYHPKPKRERSCIVCGKTFTATKDTRHHCSGACYMKTYRAKGN